MKPQELKGVVSIDLAKSPELPSDYKGIEATAKAFQVKTSEDYERGAAFISGAASAIAKVEAFFEEDKATAHKLHKSICDKISSITAPWRSIRANIEPRMIAYRREQERIRQEAERAAQAEATRLRLEAEVKARAIQAEADRQAAELRKAGDMKAAREAQEAAQQQAAAVVEQAQDAAELGMVLPDTKIEGGPNESRPWIGEVVDIKAICKAIGNGEIPLEHLTPTRNEGNKMLPLVEVNMPVLHNIAKRWGQQEIGIPGARGVRDLRLSFGTKGAVPANLTAFADDTIEF